MIVVMLRGGLGNQMFQYALGRHLSLANKTELALDTTFLNDRFPRKEFTRRSFDLDIFTLSPKFTALSKISENIPLPGAWLGLDLALIQARQFLGIRKLVKEKKEFLFDSSALLAGDDAFLWGRWQSPKYFEGIADIIRSDFVFSHQLAGSAAELMQKMMQENSVAIHIRRGDYVSLPHVRSLMGETSATYYADAMSYIAERVKNPVFYVFSYDDSAWAKEHLETRFPVRFVGADLIGPKFSFYLQLMSLCKHTIIANSTFSWWGAWLNRNPEKIVIAPRVWQKNVITADSDILPSGWTLM